MIIGSGDIASVLPERDDLLFFASGVSNSREDRESEYNREEDLLLEQPREAHLVYFSSLAALNGIGRYFDHKRHMEALVQAEFRRYTIIRIGNIAWGDNPHTLINHMRARVQRGEPLDIQDVWRYVVDQDEFLHWIDQIPDRSCEINIPGRRLKVKEIADEYAYVGIRPK